MEVVLAYTLIAAIYLYRATYKQILVARGVRCLYSPTCSEYARLSLLKHPVRRAVEMSYHRYLSCNQFSDRPHIDPP